MDIVEGAMGPAMTERPVAVVTVPSVCECVEFMESELLADAESTTDTTDVDIGSLNAGLGIGRRLKEELMLVDSEFMADVDLVINDGTFLFKARSTGGGLSADEKENEETTGRLLFGLRVHKGRGGGDGGADAELDKNPLS